MNYTIRNERITLVVASRGAEMQSLQMDGREYLWQGDPKYWKSRATNLFPFVGRITDGRYTLEGTEYEMIRHGFAKLHDFLPEEQSGDSITLVLHDNEETKKMYPYAFSFYLTYRLQGKTLSISAKVHNPGDAAMYFGYGGHPGFNCPLEEGTSFEDWILELPLACHADRVMMNDEGYLTGISEPYPLQEGKILPLRHDLFDHDAVILQNIPRQISLKSKKSSRSVTLRFPMMPYLGIWHANRTDAPYVCLEPWASLPSRAGIIEEFSAKSDLVSLDPGCDYVNAWSVTLS